MESITRNVHDISFTDYQVEAVEQTALQRANLTRTTD